MTEEDKKVDENENVEVDIDDTQSSEKAKEEDEAQAVVEEKPEVEEQEQEEKAEKPKTPKFQKRIDDLTYSMREAERQRDEYYKVAQKAMEENKRLSEQAKKFGEIGTQEMEGRIKSEMDSAENLYKKAYEEGDAEKIVAAQRQMIDASSRRSELAQLKQASDQSQVDNAFDQSVPPPPNTKAVAWAGQNPWFNKDMIMTNAAYTIHDELIRQGVKGDTDEYYEKLDTRIKEEFPHKFVSEEKTDQKPKSVTQTVVTPAGNQSPKKSRKVKLTPSQVAVAKRLGVPLEEYAKQFVALN